MAVKKLRYFAGGKWHESRTTKWMDCYDPSTGEVIAQAPQCTAAEVEEAIGCAQEAFPAWANTPPNKRAQVLFHMKALLDQHLEELTHLCAQENGKVWDESSATAHWKNRRPGQPFFAIFNIMDSHESRIRQRPAVPQSGGPPYPANDLQ